MSTPEDLELQEQLKDLDKEKVLKKETSFTSNMNINQNKI